MSKLKRYNDFYLKSKGLSNQNKKTQLQELSNKLFESKVKKGGNLDLVEVLLEKEAYKDGKLNESLSTYLIDEEFKQNLRLNSCAGFISEGIADLKSKSLKYLRDNGISGVEYELVDRNFDILYLGDDKIVEGFLKWVGSALASALAPVMDYILKPGWKSLRFVGSKMFGEEAMKKIELMGQKIIDKITGVFDRIDQKFQNVLDKTWSGIKSIAQKIGDFLKSFWELCKKVFNKIWEFIKGLASSAFGSISKNPRLSRLKNTLNKAESSESKAGALESEVSTYNEHVKRFFGIFKEGPAAASEKQKAEIDNSASQTFNPEGNTEVKVEENSTSFQYQVNLVCDSLLWELKSNNDFRPEDLVNMNEAHDEGVNLDGVKKEGPAGELAVSIFNSLEKTKGLLKSKDKESKEVIEILNGIKKSSEKSGVDYKEVSKHIEELFKSLKGKRISKWCIDRLGNYEDSENQESIQKSLKELGLLYDPLVDMNDEQKEISNKLWKEIDYSSHSGQFEKLKQIMQKWSADDYKLFNKQAAYKLKTGEIKKSKTGEPSLSVAFKSKSEDPKFNREFQKFLFEEKNSKNLGEDFIVDELVKSSEETKDIWSQFAKIWNKKDSNMSSDLEKLLLQVEEPKLYDELDNICRQELGFSMKKKIRDEFSGTFTSEDSKKRIHNIVKHFSQDKFGETNIKSEEATEESGFIKKWCQNAVSFLISPFGKLVELIVQGLGKMASNLPGCGVGYSWQSMSNTFKIMPEIFAVLAGIAVDAICTTKGISGLFGHKAGEAHPEPEGFFNILGARVKHSAELIAGKENVEGALKAVGGGETHHESKNTIKNYKQFINESKSKLIIESSEKEGGEHKTGFEWKSIATLGTGMLMSYVANLFSVSFPVVGIVLEGISVILLIFHLLDILRKDAPKWFGEESKLNGLTSFASKALGWVGLGH